MAESAMSPRIQATFSGSTTRIYACFKPCNKFAIVNTGIASLTFTIHDITITVLANSSFEDCFEDFDTVTVTTSVAYQAIVYSF